MLPSQPSAFTCREGDGEDDRRKPEPSRTSGFDTDLRVSQEMNDTHFADAPTSDLVSAAGYNQ